MRRTTMADIAQELGLHKSTVSLALKHSPKLTAKTRELVLECARRLGYRPDPALSQIAAARWSSERRTESIHNLAFLMNPTKKSSWVYKENQMRYFESVQAKAKNFGYALELFNLDEYPSARSASHVLLSRGIRGLILPPILAESNVLSLDLDWTSFATVCCSLGCVRPPLHAVSEDPFFGTRLAWQKLESLGYKRIGPAMFAFDPVTEHDTLRYGAVLSQQDSVPRKMRVPILKSGTRDKESFYEWLRQHKPDVVLSFHDIALQWLLEAGYRVPEDIGFASLHVISPETSQISGNRVMVEEIGHISVDLLVSLIRNNEWGVPDLPRMILLKPKWVNGSTLKKLNG